MITIINWPYRLRAGHSEDPSGGACAMDAVNWLVHGKHGDRPECACPVIGAYVIVGNDRMPDDTRQRLLSYLPRIAGSRSKAHEQARAEILARAAVRVFAPRALDAAGLHDHAARLRALPAGCTMAGAAAEAAAAQAAAAEAAAVVVEAVAAAEAAVEAVAAAEAAAWVAEAAARAAWAAAAATTWDDYFAVLDAALAAGPQGEPWSADVVEAGAALYVAAGGRVTA